MDTLIIQLIILFLPGFIWLKVEETITRIKNWNDSERVVRTIFYGIVTYVVVYLAFSACGIEFSVIKSTSDTTLFIEPYVTEIVWSIPFAIVLSVAWSKVKNGKLFLRMLQKVNVTKRYGDEDVWEYLFNSNDMETEYVHVRDFERELTYAGWVGAYSDEQNYRELYLNRVLVYDSDGVELYEVPNMYLSFKSDSLVVEFPYQEGEN